MNGQVTRRHDRLDRILVVAVGLVIFSSAASAQSSRSGSIQGRVRDETGASLPGVAVTVASPALQVPHLTATTDALGEYRFVDLPPGTYRIAYELGGFQTLVRDEVRLNAGFAAKLDIVMKVGALEESVTVSGQGPVVDTSTTAGTTNFTKEMLEKIPTSRSMWQVLAMTPGIRVTATPDVGGSTVGTQQSYRNYGTAGQNRPEIEGVDTREGTDGAGPYYDYSAFEEVQVRAVGNDAEVAVPGTNFVGIVKSGGDEFHGTYMVEGQRPELQSDNVDDALRRQGVSGGNPLKYYWDLSADLGGRIVRDKLWFYTAFRSQRNVLERIGYARTAGPDGVFGTPDDEQGENKVTLTNQTLKLSYQPTVKYKLVGFAQRNKKDEPERDGTRFRPAENSVNFWSAPVAAKVELQGTPTDRTLFNIIVSRYGITSHRDPFEDVPDKPTRYDRETGRYTGRRETGVYPGTSGFENLDVIRTKWRSQASFSFLPGDFLGGKHAFKLGYASEWIWGGQERTNAKAGNYMLIYDRVGGVPHRPVEILTYNVPILGAGNRMTEHSAYVKDTWSIGNRLTANVGLRWERYHSFVDEQTKEQGTFGSGGSFPPVDVVTWTGLAPRVGIAYDINGSGKTVLKGTYGWFNHTMGEDFAGNFNLNGLVKTIYRWRDPDGNNNYTPGEVDLDPNEADFISVSGSANNILNPDLEQPVTHEFSAGAERELMANFSARVLYVYKRQRGLLELVNVLRPYSAYNIPITRRDPGPDGVLDTADDVGSVTLYDYAPAFRGGRFVGQKFLNRDGRDDSYHTIELTLNKRTSQNWDVLASFSATRNHRWIDAIPESPNDELFPIDETWDWLVKLTGSYRFPYGIQAVGFLQHLSGDPGQRTYIFRRVDPDGGRDLAQSGTVTARLEPFGARREPNLNVLNLRAAKTVSLGASRELELTCDLFNALNANSPSIIRYVSGPTFGAISEILPPRVVRLGARFTF